LASRAAVSRTLDIGCGSGVLAIAMAKTWHRPVWAVDIDGVAAGETRANARANGVAHLIHTRCGDALHAPGISRAGPYSIITANILEGPLRKMSFALARHLSPGGSAVLSGLLPDQAERVRARYRALGLRLRHRIEIDGWVTLLLQKPSYSAASTQQSSVSNRPSG
jgi:ribosomal protein L11 methyltransferase